MTSLDDLAGDPPPRSIPRLAKLPPINLPSYTFLVGDLMNCHMFARELGEASTFVYEEDFQAPIYDAVQALYAIPHLVTPHEIATKYAAEVTAIRNAVKVDLVARFKERAEELLSFHPYQIVVRDATIFPSRDKDLGLTKGFITVNIDQATIFCPESGLRHLPPGVDLLKELRLFLS